MSDNKLQINTSGSLVQKIQDAFAAGLSRKKVRYLLTIKQLFNLELYGLLKAKIGPLNTANLALKFNGAGEASFESIQTDILDVKLANVGTVSLVGKANEQFVTITGSGSYYAPNLASQKTKVDVKGIGSATVWAIKDLEIIVTGVGTVSYYGTPQVKSKIAPVGSLNHLGEHK